jgi:hypothetical protein
MKKAPGGIDPLDRRDGKRKKATDSPARDPFVTMDIV